MSTESSFRQNPDEFHGLGAENEPENLQRGQQAAQQRPEAGQTGQPTAGHTSAPNYGVFGQPEGAAAPAPESPQARYGEDGAPEVDETHHGDDRFRHSGTRNWATDEPANPHEAKPGEWSDR